MNGWMDENEAGIRLIVVYFEGHSDIEDGLMYEPPLHSCKQMKSQSEPTNDDSWCNLCDHLSNFITLRQNTPYNEE